VRPASRLNACRAFDRCRMTVGCKTAVMVAAGMAAVDVGYAAWVRPRLMRWGATDEEVAGPYPGAGPVPGGERSATMAVTIGAPPDQVWPWLVQIGSDRGGWYSSDRFDNAGRPSAQGNPPGVARPRRRLSAEVLGTGARPHGRLSGCRDGAESVLGTACA
jgi:hypothetical protein